MKINVISIACLMALGVCYGSVASASEYVLYKDKVISMVVDIPALSSFHCVAPGETPDATEVECPSDFTVREKVYVVPAGTTVIAQAALYIGELDDKPWPLDTTQPSVPRAIPDYCYDASTGDTTCDIDQVRGQDTGMENSYMIFLDKPGFYSYKVNFMVPYIYQALGYTRNPGGLNNPYPAYGPSYSHCANWTYGDTSYVSECVNILVQ